MTKRMLALVLLGACTHAGAPAPGPGVYVDEVLGTDDAQHGHGPGAEAFATITYALTVADADIHVAAGSYATREAFPLVLTGVQHLACDAGVTIESVGGTAVQLAGDANTVAGCSVSTGVPESQSFDGGRCIGLASDGAHVVDSSSLIGCQLVVDFAGHSGATLHAVDIGTETSVNGNCLNQVGNDVRLEDFACTAASDWIFRWGTGLSGCGTTPNGRIAGGAPDGSPLPTLDGPC